MKTITFAVPCYNSATYMVHCIDTLLADGGSDIEIILINDGSSDNTGAIADDYAARFPDTIRVIHQENGGHGEGVNQGLRHAQGLYYKVVDSDDWVDAEALAKVLDKLREFAKNDKSPPVDMLIANYVYEHAEDGTSRVIRYTSALPQDKVFSWKDIGVFLPGQYLLMHSVIYRTEVLRLSGLKLPKHTFYVDNIFVYQPLPFVKTMYYINADFYRYYIGRADQSVNEAVMVKRIDQQLRVTRLMMDMYDLSEVHLESPKLGRYMTGYLSIMMTICSMLLLVDGGTEALRLREELWQELKSRDLRLYRKIRHRSLATFSVFPGNVGRKLSLVCYRIAQKTFKFN